MSRANFAIWFGKAAGSAKNFVPMASCVRRRTIGPYICILCYPERRHDGIQKLDGQYGCEVIKSEYYMLCTCNQELDLRPTESRMSNGMCRVLRRSISLTSDKLILACQRHGQQMMQRGGKKVCLFNVTPLYRHAILWGLN